MDHKRISWAAKTILMVAAILTAGGNTWAFGPGPKGPGRGGDSIERLPADYHQIKVRGKPYYHHGGRFYRPGPRGYVPVSAPRGAVIHALPIGFATLVIAGITYFTFADIYYRRVDDGYMVVEKPVETVVVQKEVTVASPASPVGVTVTVTVGSLNVRSAPGKEHPVTDLVHKDDNLVIRGYAPQWYFVELPSGRFGWVMMKFTDPVSGPGVDPADPPAEG